MTNSDRQYVLLDRDGVINEDRPGSLLSLADLALLPEAPRAIALLNEKGYGVLVITNQACISRGELTLPVLDSIHGAMLERIANQGGRIENIYVCPHSDENRCLCRKPRPGLIKQAQRDYGFIPERTWLVGDDRRDIAAARAAHCRPALVRTGKGGLLDPPAGVPVYRDLLDFAERIEYLEQVS